MTNFQRFALLRWALVLCGAAILVVVAGIAFGQTTFALQPASNSQSALDPPKGSRLITLSQMNLPGIDGTTIRSRKTWPWSFVDNCAATARQAGDMWTWLPCGGDERDPKTGRDVTLTEKSLSARFQLYRDGAARYRADPFLYAVHATVPPLGHSEECFYGKRMSAAAKDAQKMVISVAASSFPRQKIIWTGSAEDPAANLEIIRYGVKAAPGRFVYKMNAMSPKPNWNWAGTTLFYDAVKAGADIGFEQLQPSNHPSFGGTWQQFVAKVAEVERRAGKPFAYRAIYPGDLRKVAPGSVGGRIGHNATGNTKTCGDGTVRLALTPSLSCIQDLVVSQCGIVSALAVSVSPLRHLVVAVVLVGANSQVLDVHASGVVAHVQNYQSVRDYSELEFVDGAMGTHQPSASAHFYCSVARAIDGTSPRNAAVFVGNSKPLANPIFKRRGLNLKSMAGVGTEVGRAFARWQDNAFLAAHFTWFKPTFALRLVMAFARAKSPMPGIAGEFERTEHLSALLARHFGFGFEARSRALSRAEFAATPIDLTNRNLDINAANLALSFDHRGHSTHSIGDKRVASLYLCSHVQATGDLAKVGAK